MKRIGILSLMLLSAILCAASDRFARARTEENTAGVQPGASAFAAGAPSKNPFTLDPGGIPGLGDKRSVNDTGFDGIRGVLSTHKTGSCHMSNYACPL